MKYLLAFFLFVIFMACDFEKPGDYKAKGIKKAVKANKSKTVIEGNVKKTFFSDGTLKSEVPFITKSEPDDSIKSTANDGLVKYYYKTGKTKSEIMYDEGIRDGEAKMYYPSGELRVLETYKNGKLEGKKIKYFINGKPKIESYFKNGVPTKTCKLFDYEGNKLPQPKLLFSIIDKRIQSNQVYIKIEPGNLKKYRKVEYSVVLKTQNGNDIELDIPVKRGIAEFTLPVSPNILYVKKLYVNAKYILSDGVIGSIVDSKNLVFQSLY